MDKMAERRRDENSKEVRFQELEETCFCTPPCGSLTIPQYFTNEKK